MRASTLQTILLLVILLDVNGINVNDGPAFSTHDLNPIHRAQQQQQHTDTSSYNTYRISHDPEDFTIGLLVNPCGVNGTREDFDESIPLGYDCCMNRFGRGEYGFQKYMDGHEASKRDILQKRIPTHPNEVLHNMLLVDEYGEEIPYEYSRRADDHTYIDDSCVGLRDPHPSCIRKRFRAVKSNRIAPCSDHNQTVDASLNCHNPVNGSMKSNCMQISYSQNSFIHICGGDDTTTTSSSTSSSNSNGYDESRCGTFIEIHQVGGNQYDSEDSILAETKINTRFTDGMLTTTIPLTYKDNKDKLLCSYNNSDIRIGSMVRIKDDSPACCCPRLYDTKSRKGSFFCPRKPGTKHGPFADKVDTLMEYLVQDEDQDEYPFCDMTREDEDVLMCSKDVRRGISNEALNQVFGSVSEFEFVHTTPCDELMITESGKMLSSEDIDGEYESTCPLGSAFQSCGLLRNDVCEGNDDEFSFHGLTGKVVHVISSGPDEQNRKYGITFNDGRTVYDFPEHNLELQQAESNYELWFVVRNRFERILQKRKGFRVIWPQCTFDISTNQYYPFAVQE